MKDINKDQMDGLINMASDKMGADPEVLRRVAESGEIDKLLSKLSQKDAAKLQEVLMDKEAAEKLLSTPQARQLLKKFIDKK